MNAVDGETHFTLADVLSSAESLPPDQLYVYSGPLERATDLLGAVYKHYSGREEVFKLLLV